MIEELISAMEAAVSVIKEKGFQEVLIFHHNDTDGLCSGAVLSSAFDQCGYRVKRFSLEKPYPQVLERIFPEKGRIVVFADFAGKIAPVISRMNDSGNLVVILDHHPAEKVEDGSVYNLDGELFGLKGDRDISASATAYLFAEALMRLSGIEEVPPVHLGVLGAIGDGFFVNGALSGVNRRLLSDALEQGCMRVERGTEGEIYFITLGGKEYPALYICNLLDTLGGVGYYADGTSRGIDVCLKGLDEDTESYSAVLEERKKEIFARERENLGSNLKTTDNIQWFDVKERFEPMGVKMIGVFCTIIKDSGLVSRDKYLAGFQHVPDRVPGFGEISFNSTKVSMRVSAEMTERIRKKSIPGLNEILPEATEVLGGFSDACHSLSAATAIEIGREEELVDEMEKVLARRSRG